MKAFLPVFLLLCLSPTSANQILGIGSFCNLHSECIDLCCYNMKCEDADTCKMIDEVDKDEGYLEMCEVNIDCSSQCCAIGKCQSSGVCFVIYDLPLLIGIAIAICIAMMFFCCVCLLLLGKASKSKTKKE